MNTSLKAAFLQKCPRCHQGDIFKHELLNRHFMHTYENCPHCGFRYEREPGFFYGAMYFTYAINVVIIITTGLTINVLFYPSTFWLVTDTILVALAFVPINYRYSRVIMLYLFGGAND